MRSLPNLAARPFVNRRPLRRVALAAWVTGGLLAAFDASVYWRYAAGEGRREQRVVELEKSIAQEQARIDAAAEALVAIDLDWQAEQVRFVNLKADEQAFSWSRLFDQLGEVLPDGVRLSRLDPGVGRVDAQRLALEGVGEVEPRRVTLTMSGAARSSDALYEFVDALFAHPAFERPNLQRENERDEVEFSLTALYLPEAGSGTPAQEAEGSPPLEASAGGSEEPATEVSEEGSGPTGDEGGETGGGGARP